MEFTDRKGEFSARSRMLGTSSPCHAKDESMSRSYARGWRIALGAVVMFAVLVAPTAAASAAPVAEVAGPP